MRRRSKEMERERQECASTSAAPSGASAALLEDIQEPSLGEMKKLTETEKQFADLHAAIADGDFDSVRLTVESHAEELYFPFNETSALYKAFQCKKYQIISFLIHKGAKFVAYESDYVYDFDIDLDRLNHLLFDYNNKSEKSCIYRLMSLSQSPQDLDGERLNAINSMYEHFFKSDIIKLLMKVLEREQFDIVYDFHSDKVNKIHRLYEEEAEIFGLTLTKSKVIFVGAEHLLSGDQRKRAKVYGVVAEELCHLAMTTVFKNNAKPYREEDSDLIKEFHDIVLAVKAFTARSCHIASVIQDVFENYKGYAWECELIARVPHIVGIYGEDEGRKIFQESSELYSLLKFYEHNVFEKCKLYIEPSTNTKNQLKMEQLVTIDFISYKEKQLRPLKEDFQSFRMYLVEWESIYVITTNCTRLCMLHVYHELKKEYGYLVEKKCLFFSRKCFEKKIYEIRDAMKGNLWDYLVLVMDKRELNMSRFQAEYLDHLEDFTSNGMKLIMISSTQSSDVEFDFEKAVNYKWSDLSEDYKTILQCITYLFKGEEEVTYVRKENFQKVFSEDDISVIISSELIKVDDGCELFSQGYIPETYIEREFHTTVVDDKIFTNLPPHTNIFLSGLQKSDHKEFPFLKHEVLWLTESHDEIQSDKSMFIIKNSEKMSFEDIKRKGQKKNNIWLHYDEKEFYVRNVDSPGDVFGRYMKQRILREEEILNILKRERTVIISDNAGYGKSTVISNFISNVKRNNYRTWNWRINFNKFSGDKTDPLSIANVEEKGSDEEVFNHLFRILGLRNGLERHLFMKLSKEGRCFIFFDGFDEIPSEYVRNALKLLSTVRKQTAVNMIISTRKHHQEELENFVDTYSHQLIPLSKENQVRYLEQLWKNKLKYPFGKRTSHNDKGKVVNKIRNIIMQSEVRTAELEKELSDLIIDLKKIELGENLEILRRNIDDLEVSKLAVKVIDKSSLDKDTLEFMGIPLHLFMIGVIYFDSNFNVEVSSGIHSIYSKFIDQKIVIYVEEKQRMCHNKFYDKIVKETRQNTYRIHIDLANQLMENGKIDSEMSEETLELCNALGIMVIKGGEVDFLHLTFAEFFKAESMRLNLNKKGFTHVLFEDKYNVVLRFFASSLETNHFENLTKEFLKDLHFLFDVLKQFLSRSEENSENVFRKYELDLQLSLVAKIVKCLLEELEKSVDSEILNAIVVKLVSKFLSVRNWFTIGGCFPVKMLRMLLSRNVKLYSKMMFGAVQFYSNPDEVIDLFNEYLSIAFHCDSSRGRNEDKKAKSLLELFQFKRAEEFSSIRGCFNFVSHLGLKEGKKKGLLEYATWNVRIDVLPSILQFSKDILEREQFIGEVIQSREYQKAMKRFVKKGDVNRIIGLLKALHCVFGNEIEMFFDENLKFRILARSVSRGDGSRNTFKEVISLFKKYFPLERLKEVLQSCDSDGKYLIHYLATENGNVIENLNVVESILGDKSKMKQFLMFEDAKLGNFFHSMNGNFGEVLPIFNEHLEKAEIVNMLLSTNDEGENILHALFRWGSLESIIEYLNLTRSYLADDDRFAIFLKSKNRDMWNIFHFAAWNRHGLDLSFLDFYLSRAGIKQLLIERDQYGQTLLYWATFVYARNLHRLLQYSIEILKDDRRQFEEFILATDIFGNTFLHLFVETYYINFGEEFVIGIIKPVKENVSEDVFRTWLRIRNRKGETFLQIKCKHGGEIIKACQRILEKPFVEELLRKNRNVCGLQ